ncbi:PREDICTED: endoplasmic reticulum oxidoreductin-1 [Tarenaya hassleriana]|uniref:endoplasmic reticulum oxidoreductin-1 n=1 Tax=Tarenaya hassleriana TaxID=28532 RepID=UPI00053C6387|nr:PREDICTED: endoplasmic reticulum oxidoreductin-1 [Tarenaya hassleriana]XP_010537664.1 PREDICTED: endoplasmic reticulum oxidoreductin-1 [Tarenaya hassleriana]
MARGAIKEEREERRRRWKWALGAFVVVLLAVAVSSRAASNVGLLFGDRKSCSCSLQGSGKYKGMIEGCCCDYETADSLNTEVLHPLLQELVTTPFFRYFKVKLWCDCPFWPDDGMCRLRDCSVCECPENEFPEPFKKPYRHGLPSDNPVCQEGKPESTVDRTIDNRAFKGWVETDNPWTHDDETDNGEMTYVNLLLNPERYTGYIGPSARRIWDAIYSENCPKYSSGEICPEKKVLYKLISGLHSSISMHIADDYLLDESSNQWGQNIELMYDRVLRYPDRVRNLYFTYLFVLRAVTKATEYLEQAEYNTGNHAEDLKTQSLIKQLLYNPKLQTACPVPFDEAKLWQGQSGPELKQQIQKQFRNISALMDCVGCEKCRLWGKLQVQGLGTALKILFSVNNQHMGEHILQLQRNEVIALVNLLNRLSESVKIVHDMGPSVEQIMEKQTSNVMVQHGRLRRIWDSAVAFWPGRSPS